MCASKTTQLAINDKGTRLSEFLKKQSIQYFLIGVIVCGVLLVVFNPSVGLVQQGSDFAVHFMLAYLVGGLFFLILNQRNLMLACFIACVVLCLFLKDSSNSAFLFPQINRGASIRVAHVDLSAAGNNYDVFMKSILNQNADVISFQEVDPNWNAVFDFYLTNLYPHSNLNIRIDPFGMAVFSKKPIIRSDTLFFEDYPTLLTTVFVDNQKSITIMSSYTMPGLDNNFKANNRRYLAGLAQEILKSRTPVISIGKFNMAYWNNDLKVFANRTDMEHSRRDAVAAGLTTPYDHIYYTNELECTSFYEILDSERNHQGIIGNYQFKILEQNSPQKKTPTVDRF